MLLSANIVVLAICAESSVVGVSEVEKATILLIWNILSNISYALATTSNDPFEQ